MTSNYCIECGVDMGPSNPRQLCCKSYCDKSYCDKSYCDKSYCNDDKSICIDDDKSICIDDDKSICIDEDKSICIDEDKSICNDDKSICIDDDKSVYNDDKSVYNDDKSFYEPEPDAVAQDEPSSPHTDELEAIQTYKKYRNEHIHALSTLEAKVAHLEKQVNWLMKSSSSSSSL